jgi:hypothetical protein
MKNENNVPMQRAFVTLNPQLELVSFTEAISLWCPLSVDDALGLAQEMCAVMAQLDPATGTPFADEVQKSLSQAHAWLEKAKAAVKASRLPTTNALN